MRRVAKVISNLWALSISFAALVIGGVLVVKSQTEDIGLVLARDFGSALLITGLIGVGWDLVLKRAFAGEILAKTGMARELEEAGIRHVGTFRDPPIDWPQLFQSSSRVDIFVAYARTWRRMQMENLNRFLSRPGAQLRVVLPDLKNKAVADELARRFNYTSDWLAELVEEAKAEYRWLSELHPDALVEIWSFAGALQFSFYKFDDAAVISLFTHVRGEPVLTFGVEGRGRVYAYLEREAFGTSRPRGANGEARPSLEASCDG